MAKKTYVSDKKNLAVGWDRKNASGDLKSGSLNFVDGVLVLEEEDAQKFLESLPVFKDGTVSLLEHADVVAEAAKKAKLLRDIADKAELEAVEAEKAHAALLPKKEASADLVGAKSKVPAK